jgi:hypothetical protein
MKLYFVTRNAARSSLKAHKLVDAGAEAPKGRRYARELKPVVKAIHAKDFVQATTVCGQVDLYETMLEAA